MITADNISKAYNGKNIIQNFSAKISEGEFICILGKSGSGKSTLLGLLSLMIKPDAGSVSYNQQERITGKSIQKIRREVISYLFQNYALLENETVLNNLKLGGKLNPANTQNTYSDILVKVRLESTLLNKKIYQLSGGQQQRVALARVLLKKFNVLFADEPTGNLDEENTQFILNIFKELCQTGKTVVVVTHDKQIATWADRIIYL